MKRFLLRTILVLLTGCIGSNAIAQTNLYNYSVLSGTFSDISSTGTVVGGSVPLGATVLDRTTTSIPIGFTFNFCGTNYTQLSASNHCWLSLANSGSTIYVNAAGNIPSAGFLYFFWDDMGGSGADAYYQTTGTAPNRVFTIQYTDWRGNPSPWTAGTGTSDMQVKLYETTNVIEYWYGPGTLTGLTSSVGIANSTTDYKSANAGYATATYGSIYTAHSTPPTSGTILRWSTCSVTATPATSGAVCPGGTVTLTATTSGTSYSWTGPAGYTSTNLTNVLTGVTTTGVYTFSATNGTCTTTATTTVSVNPVPPAPTLTPSVTTMCNGAVQSLTSSAAAVWSPTTDLYTDAAYTTPYTGGVTSTVYVHPTTVTAVTVRTYTATVTNGFGCTNSSVATVTINPATAAITGTLSVCAGYTTTLSSSSAGGTWSSTATGVATVGSSSGIVTGGSPGTSTIIYTVAGCSSVAVVTVTPTPAAITGVNIACLGATTTLSTTPAGGTWSSSNTAVGTVNSSTGVVGGISLGTCTITYDLGSGCFVTRTVSVNPIPAAISGPASVCLGASATLTSSPSGGIWTATSTPAGVCSVGPTTGIVNGLALGTSTIRYQVAGCSVTRVMTVVATSTPPFGPTVCVGSTGTFTTTATGGTWSSSNTAVGTIGSTTGVLYGVSAGTTIITYALSAGCTSTVVATVTPAPSAIVGATSVCEGLTTTLTHPTAGGTWTSSDPSIASVGLGTGVVTGVSATPAPGTATITYTLPSGCFTTMTFTVLPTPGAITGTLALCQSQTATLSSSTIGGTWSSGTTTVATIDAATGLWTAVGTGTSTITYTSAAGCITTAVVTVNGIPSAITGPGAVCAGQTITLSSATPMGAWSSSDPTVGTISGSGDVTGLTAGTTDITYALASGCFVTKTVTVNAGPAAITGSPLGICVGASTFLSCITPGGTWTSAAPTVASILSPGMIGGVSVGTATISYTIGATGCASTVVVTVNTLPGAIGGTLNVCAGQTSTLTNSSAGGSWSSAIPLVGTIDPTTGVFGGVAAGTTTITYSLGTGCTVTAIATVNATPTITGGSTNICAGTTTTFTGSPTGGTWASGTTTVATIGVGTGLATGVAPGGTTTITYTLTSGCRNTTVLTVTPLPAVITGTTSLCVGQTTTLSSATAGGTWSSSNPAVGTISTGGVVTGLGAGTTTITYAVSGCARTTVVLVNGLPTSITPAGAQVCEGSTISMTGAPSGGTWSSSCTGVGSIATGSGTYTGISAGTCTVTYTLSTGCSLVSSPITVNALPATISGVASVCVGQTTTLNSTPATGTWSLSSGTGTATIGSTTGVVTGGTAGTVNVTYTLPTGCRRTIVVTVNALPGLITGAANVCAGSTTTMNCTPAGGTWTISGSIATIGVTTGIVTGSSAGTTEVTYTAGAGCYSTRIITVNPVPDPITGTATTCVGQTTTLSTLSTGGTWSISPLATATIGSGTGVVTGVSGGTGSATATVTYTLPTTCRTTQIVTVYALPSAISGSLQVCESATGTLTTTTPGGVWSSSNPAVATVGSTSGDINGIVAGTTNITYTLGTGCQVTAVATVNPIPAAIGGTLQVCEGQTTTLSNTTPSGTWSSSTPGTATVGASTGIVTGIVAGTSAISYTLSTGCRNTAIVTVHALPAIITGPAPMWVCENATVTLSSSPAGGVWSSANAEVTVNPATGDVTGISAGTATISYMFGIGCVRTTTVTVQPQPAAITGNLNVCVGLTQTLATLSSGGTWSSSNPASAPVDVAGTVSGVALGTANISYTLPVTGCSRFVVATVQPLPSTITGPSGFCNLSSTTYLSSPGGGTWTSDDTLVLTIDPTTGLATGVNVDTATITYTLPTGCKTTKDVFLILAPYPITGTNDMCLGQVRMLSNVITGGVWGSSNPGVALVDPVTGAVTGMSIGNATITYTLSTGCASTHPVTVNPIPVGTTGPIQICEGNTAIYSNATPGGTWSTSDTTIATINTTSGLLTAVSGGVVTVTYTLGSGCNAMFTVTVNGLPGAISGPNQVCEGSTISLSTTSTTGLWSSADPGVANAGALTGVITGMSAMTPGVMGMGVTLITYTLPTGCFRTHEVTVNPLPNIIVGNSDVCVGDVALYTCATPGGGWVSSNPAQGTIDGVTGVFGGISAGTVIISYVLPTGCIATKAITVHDNPAPISGSLSVCAGFATNLISSPAGGTWSQNPTSMPYGTIHTLTGVVSGITAGVIPVTYTLGSGCRAVNEVTVITLPAVVGGPSQVCVNDSIVMTHPTAGGTWSSSNAARATVDPLTGLIHGISAGTAVITYSVSTGCFNVRTITVNALPTPITGPLQVCEGSTITLGSTPSPGGVWTSDTTAAATVGYLSGVVTGIAAGYTNISYVLGATGCLTRVQVTVNVTPPTITGNPHICFGSSNTFSNTMAGGSWFSSNPAIATIDPATGVATSVSLGVITISYVLPVTGCMATKTVSVDPLPNVYNVTGGGNYCAGGTGVTIGLNNSQPGVSYELYRGSSVTGYLPGTGFGLNFGPHTAAGVYTVLATDVTSGCQRNMSGSANVVINPLITPTVSIGISPYDSVCPGQSVTLTAVPVNGGAAPTYLWKVNGVSVSTSGSYAFVPAHGDNVTVTMTSNANCLATTTATGVRNLTVLPTATPVAGVLTTPNDTICQFNPVTFTAAPSYGGATPVYQWLVNGVVVGTGSTYSYIPVDGDVVNLRMTSDYRCRTVNTVTSGDVAMSVDSILIPKVTVWPEPGFVVTAGKPVVLHASVEDAGPNPKFQWKVNGYPVPGATNDSYTAIFNDYDSISCIVTSSGVCANIGTHDWVFITTTPLGTSTTAAVVSDLRLLPNPNKGIFTVRGTLGTGNEDVNIDVTDMLGQVVYRGAVTTKQGRLETQINLDGSLANGMYILTLRSGTEQKVFHFVMEQ